MTFTFVTDGVESAVKQARAAAGAKNVTIWDSGKRRGGKAVSIKDPRCAPVFWQQPGSIAKILGSVGKIVWIEGASLSATKWTSLSMLKRYGKTADRLIALRIGNATSQVSR